jgi:hypothetical protein
LEAKECKELLDIVQVWSNLDIHLFFAHQ